MIHSINGYQLSINKFIKYQKDSCDDQFVGVLTFNGNKFVSILNNDYFDLKRKKNTNAANNRIPIDYINQPHHTNGSLKLVILLESPHVDEYLSKSTNPAWGSTGNKLNSQFIKVLNIQSNLKNICSSLNLNGNVSFDVYIVNAIQYQCSLGLSPLNRSLKDSIFHLLWNSYPNSFKQDLIDRLLFIKPDIIINACTINLQRICVNASSIMPLLNIPNLAFLSSNKHLSAWDKNTIVG